MQYQVFNGKIDKERGHLVRDNIKIPKTLFDEYNESHITTKYVEDAKATKEYMKLFKNKPSEVIELNELNETIV